MLLKMVVKTQRLNNLQNTWGKKKKLTSEVIDKYKTHQWLESAGLKTERGAFIMA